MGIARSTTAPEFVVDTTKRWEDVFADATRYIIANMDEKSNMRGHGINFLSLATFPKKKNGSSLPSWVPDLADLASISTLAAATAGLPSLYHADGEALVRHDLSFSDSKVLGCRGIIIDRITEVGPTWEGDPTNRARPRRRPGVYKSVIWFVFCMVRRFHLC